MSDARHDLLFGVLAVQLDFLTVETLAAHLTGDGDLSARLLRGGALSEARRKVVDRAVREHLDAHAGDAEGTLASLRVEPTLGERLRRDAGEELQQTLSLLPGADTPAVAPDQTDTTAAHEGGETLGRYRVLRHHADGGLGMVSVALDTELGREVALKEVLPQYRNHDAATGRFVREAKVTGHLEHPGVVPVHGLGLHEGRPFYAMRFVRGDSMKVAIADFHRRKFATAAERNLALRALLGRFTDVCDAIHYAHSRGVLHRDVKPENVMLGKYGETLVVDWGLAKTLGTTDPETTEMPVAAGDGSGTQAGSAIGTPAYMSPEQAEGRLDLLGPATDVWALGGTLVTLLTGKLPIDATTRAETLEKVRRGATVVAGSCPRRVSEPLWSIGRKAMSRDIDRRYATAAELAADVQRWLADEPVRAHRDPLQVRVFRWVRKHPSLSSATATTVLLATVALVSLAGWHQRNLAVRRAEAQLQREVLERDAEDLIDRVAALRDESSWDAAQTLWTRLTKRLEQDAPATLRLKALRAGNDLRTALGLELALFESIGLAFDQDRRREIVRHNGRYHNLLLIHGLDVLDGDPAEVGQAIAESDIKTQILHVLDDWIAYPDTAVDGEHLLRVRLAAAPSRQVGQLLERLNADEADRLGRPLQLKPSEFDPKSETAASIGLRARLLRRAVGARQPEVLGYVEDLLRAGTFLYPQSFELHVESAQLLENTDPPRWLEALGHYQAALAVRQDVLGIWDNAGNTLRHLGRLQDAELHHMRAIRTDPNADRAHGNLAVTLKDLGRIEESLEHNRQAMELDHDAPLWPANRIQSLCDIGRFEEAVALAEKTLAAHPQHPSVTQAYARAANAVGKLEEGERYARKTLELARDPQTRLCAHSNLGYALNEQGRHDEALDALDQAVAIDPESAAAHSNRAHSFNSLGRYEEAEAAARKAVALEPENALFTGNLLVALKALNRTEELVATLGTQVAEDPQADAYAMLSDAYNGLGRHADSVDAAREAIRLDPEHAPAHSMLGRTLSDMGRHEEAVVACREAVALDERLAAGHGNLGRALSSLGRHDEAEAALNRALDLDPQLSMGHLNLGVIYSDTGRPQKALQAYAKALALKPQFGPAHSNRGMVLKRLGRLDEAATAYREAIRCGFGGPLVLHNLAHVLHKLGRLEEAEAVARQCVAEAPAFWVGHSVLADVLQERNDLEGAEAVRRRAVELTADGPDVSKTLLQLGLLLRNVQRPDEALGAFLQAAEADSGELRAWASATNILVGREEFAKVVEIAEPALAEVDGPKEPQAAMILRLNLGKALSALERPTVALAQFERLVADHPDQPVFGMKVAETQRAMGDCRAAAETCRGIADNEAVPKPMRQFACAQGTGCERSAELAARLPQVLAGEAEPAGAEELLALASFCANSRKRDLDAARLYRRALAWPDADRVERLLFHRFNAGAVASRLAEGVQRGGQPLDHTGHDRWRAQALAWMLSVAEDALAQNADEDRREQSRTALQALRHWSGDEARVDMRTSDPDRRTRLEEAIARLSAALKAD